MQTSQNKKRFFIHHNDRKVKLVWIFRAKQQQTREKRLSQMLNELKKGDVYMKMAYKPKERKT